MMSFHETVPVVIHVSSNEEDTKVLQIYECPKSSIGNLVVYRLIIIVTNYSEVLSTR